MPDRKISMAFRNYDRTDAIIRGLVRIDGIDLQITEMKDLTEMFTRFFRGEFDVSEMSLTELVYYTSRDKNDFIGIPVFLARVFRHSFIFCNAQSQIKGPEFLEGKKIGFPRLTQSACVWIRGTLVEEYGLSPQKTPWYVAATHHWDDDHERENVTPRDGSVTHWLEGGTGERANEVAESALIEGKIDALGTARVLSSFVRGDQRVKRLFDNYKDVEASYFKKTAIFPIMHVLAVQKSVVEKHPDLPVQLFDLFSRAKKLGLAGIIMDPDLSLIWKNHYRDEEQKTFEEDFWAYGLEKNHHVISKFLSYCYNMGICEKKLNPRDLFVPSTWDLKEKA